MTKPKTHTVDIAACQLCGTHAVIINGHRVTNHKCAGAWNIIRTETVEHKQFTEAFKQHAETS